MRRAPVGTPDDSRANPSGGDRYAYLLGLYLGDGTVHGGGAGHLRLAICLDAAYPGIVAECAEASAAVSGNAVQIFDRPGMKLVQCGWKGWLEAFPQHGRGRKHERPIVLEPWQVLEELVGPKR